MSTNTVVIGLLGTTLDQGKRADRWQTWRPSVALCRQPDLIVNRFDLLHSLRDKTLAELVRRDIQTVSPETEVHLHQIEFGDPWDFEQVYEGLFAFAKTYPFDDSADYLIHITTGTHVAQICLFLLTESRWLPARLLQCSPDRDRSAPGTIKIIDLDLSRYDRIASRFQQEQREGASFLKGGIETRNKAFNQLIDRIEQVALSTRDPILLMGPTGAGKSRLARRIYELKKARHAVKGEFVDINCATVRGDGAMSTLFGHTKGAFTGALKDRPGLLRSADGGVLFLDEIGELGLDEQAMLLRALEDKTFLPLGSDRESRSDFQLIAGTNRDLYAAVREGRFREDLMARINLWTFSLPGLQSRPEDLEPNLQFELDQYAEKTGHRVTFNKEARAKFLEFALSPGAAWKGNFRDLNAAVVRMATLSLGGRISTDVVQEEVDRLMHSWQDPRPPLPEDHLGEFLPAEQLAEIDLFDRAQLQHVLKICATSRSLSEAGRTLFSASRGRKTSSNDADRLRKYLNRFGIEWSRIAQTARVVLAGLVLLFGSSHARAATFDLRSSNWTVTIDPATLAVSARLAGGNNISISSEQPALGKPTNLTTSAKSAIWYLGNPNITAAVSLENNTLTVQFTTHQATYFTWPTYHPPAESVTYIIPKGEGLLVDPHSPVWQPPAWPLEMNTTEDFSLPLWGVMGQGWTLTYLLENPFENTFAFRPEGKSLSWSLRHDFKPIWKEKEFGFVIVLGRESPIEPALEYRRRLIASGQFVSMQTKIAHTPNAAKLLGAAHAYVWDLSTQLLNQLTAAGFDRMWLGIPELGAIEGRQEIIRNAVARGYLIGPYDSYDSIHSPHQQNTWETAQFDEKLFAEGPIVGQDGNQEPGFQKKGYWLSSVAARPYVERRVTQTFGRFPFNSFFMDCDAAGDLRDNYSPRFRATQADDMRERLSRMQWIVDHFKTPIGSEDGHWYAAPIIHFAHGMMTPVFGYGDARLRGRYWPPDGPEIFMKPMALPDDYRAIYFDPRNRIPLFQAVFHDSVITTHHWERPSLKYSNVTRINTLLELLYNVPPLYHFNSKELARNAESIARYYRFFSPLLRQTALLPMHDFRWLTPDHLVQSTTYGQAIEMIANFRSFSYTAGEIRIPPLAIAVRHLDGGRTEIFQP
jgi:transcriptional regulatory protein RtcR